MQPPARRLRLETPARRTRRRTGRSASGRRRGRYGIDRLTFLERDRRLLDDLFVALEAGLDVDHGPQVAAEHDLLEVQLVAGSHEVDPGSLSIEDERGGGDPPPCAGGSDFEIDVDEHSRQHPM